MASLNAKTGGSGQTAKEATVSQALPDKPSVLVMAASFAGSMSRFAASGFKTVDEPLHELRMSHCGPCEYQKETQCTLCRCFIAKKAMSGKVLR
jgi:hypothetical protein